MGNTQNKQEVQVRPAEDFYDPKPLMLLKYELLREFNFCPKELDSDAEAVKIAECYRQGISPEDLHPHIILSRHLDVELTLPKDEKPALDQKGEKERHLLLVDREKHSILRRLRYLDPYNAYAHITEFEKMHLADGACLRPTNYNHGMQAADLELQARECFFTRD